MHVSRPASNWSADRMSQQFPEFADGSQDRAGPVYFFGEMVRSFYKRSRRQRRKRD